MLGLDPDFWHGRSVFVTGHTGFKGSWLALWLQQLGARVSGYALAPATSPSLFDLAEIAAATHHRTGDIRDYRMLATSLADSTPEIVFHLAAQALVREGYRDPLTTITSNVTGTAHVLEAARHTPSVRAVVVVTSDKCYDNKEWLWPYRENEPLGGRDPYSASKACAELVTAAWRSSFPRPGFAIASARAGNVIGGGDWATDRLVPDALRSWTRGEPLQVRHPGAVRPWQHVLEPLHGYLVLAQHLFREEAADAWNFGPDDHDMIAVGELLNRLAARWGSGARWHADAQPQPHEASLLRLDSTRARLHLGWKPVWNLDQALARTINWHRGWTAGADMKTRSLEDITHFQHAATTANRQLSA